MHLVRRFLYYPRLFNSIILDNLVENRVVEALSLAPFRRNMNVQHNAQEIFYWEKTYSPVPAVLGYQLMKIISKN